MPFTLYSAFVAPALRLLANVAALVEKAGRHCEDEGLEPPDLLDARLAPDMLPFSYQVKSTIVHSVGAFHGARRAHFSPDTGPHDFGFAEMGERLAKARDELHEVRPEQTDEMLGRPMRFEACGWHADFTVEHFLTEFSLPNLYFQASTAYRIMRSQGLDIGKVDYLGRRPMVLDE